MHLSNTPYLPHIQLNMNRGKYSTMSNFQPLFTHLHSPWMPLIPILVRKTKNNQSSISVIISLLFIIQKLFERVIYTCRLTLLLPFLLELISFKRFKISSRPLQLSCSCQGHRWPPHCYIPRSILGPDSTLPISTTGYG